MKKLKKYIRKDQIKIANRTIFQKFWITHNIFNHLMDYSLEMSKRKHSSSVHFSIDSKHHSLDYFFSPQKLNFFKISTSKLVKLKSVTSVCISATSEGSMSMTEGEKLKLIELDQGDGWTRVRKMNDYEEGFVPTTYIQVVLDNNC